ncbi:MAG: chromosome segregation protein SMC [Acidobacteriaceae bacterium]
MLELKRIHILGFKSFCDRTEVLLDGHGVTAIVGPNGCGKSNISDAISWVLGEQSAKTLRGVKMEDVIFSGTRDRKATGMAEVSLILVDPEVYQPASASGGGHGPEIVEGDWDEAALRTKAAQETEETVAYLQPGQLLEDEEGGAALPAGLPAAAPDETSERVVDGSAVVLKVRRRKFQRNHAQDGEVVITRRLFRTGESEYLLNGKLCRLRDIHDVLMGTGLGSESYGIIEQERIGQLLSSKPHDRRAIIEEAAGITRFKTKKRLAELRLEQAKQNLARVNDIFDEVTRQMNSLKRQAAKAERYGALRDELRQRLRVVLATRLSMMDAASVAAAKELAQLTVQIDDLTQTIAAVDQQRAAAVAEGYTREQQAREAAARTNAASVELERTLAQLQSNRERASDLVVRLQAAQSELAQTQLQLNGVETERNQQQTFLAQAQEAADAARRDMQARQNAAQKATSELAAVDQRIETSRRQMLHWMGQANQVRNQITQGEASLENLQREANRLATERGGVQAELEKLGVERGQVSMTFQSASTSLQDLEASLKSLRAQLDSQRAEETASRRHADQLRAEQATQQGRRNSLEALIREHSYSTDTVRKLLRTNTMEGGHAPVGVLADFVEVSDRYENVVDEFLRDELSFIVVKSWNDAQEGMRVLKTDVDGRATFLVHPDDSQAKFSFAPGAVQPLTGSAEQSHDGVVRLKDCIRVLDGFGSSLEVILPKLRNGYVVPDSEIGHSLALENPEAFFLAPNGECFHNVTVTGGKPSAEGPLALKRELRAAQQTLARTEEALAMAETHTVQLAHAVAELNRQIETKSNERRKAEQESANTGAALRQLEAEVNRLERRLSEWTLQADRNKQAHAEKTAWVAQRHEEVDRHEQERSGFEQQLNEAQGSLGALRAARDTAQQQMSQASVELAGLEERRRGAANSTERLERMHQGLRQRVQQLEQQLASGEAEQQQRVLEQERLQVRSQELETTRDAARKEAEELALQTAALRQQASEVEQQVRALRVDLEAFRDRRSEEAARAARLSSDLAHLEETCVQELSLGAGELRADESIARLEAESLAVEEDDCRTVKQKLEAMGPVNMMALDEYKEAFERHGFLEAQRKDLVDSIDNTLSSIREIETVLRSKFEEAFAAINENFSATFTHLFGGGQAFMKLTDQENSDESGVDIIASPPGKKLQNVLLLSGGEKALTALSLLMAIFQYQPSPFCVLDEVDAALDESNVGRLANMLEKMSGRTHFIVITHSKRMMQAADAIFGVTMQEPGVSKIVSVRLGRDRSPDRRQELATA